MRIAELIAIASIRSGKERKELAREMGIDASRLSNLASGKLKATASEIAYLATAAHTNVLQAIADVETEREPKMAAIWQLAMAAKS